MHCPRCTTRVAPGCDYCGHCGFSLAMLRSTLGSLWVRLDRITDAGHCLRLADRQRLERHLDDFERQFPQCFVAVYLGALPSAIGAGEVGFWLLNHGAFNTHLLSKRNDFGVMLVIDPFTQQTSLTVGYGLEQIFDAPVIAQRLTKIAGLLRRRHHAKVIHKVLDWTGSRLRAAAECTLWAPDSPDLSLNDITDMGFQPLKPEAKPARKLWRS